MEKLISIRRDLHRIPEPGYKEFKTQQYLIDYIRNLPQDRIEWEKWRTGIFVRVKGLSPEKTIGYRADIDGLPIREETELPFKSEHADYMHACGHDFHMTIALGVLTNLVENPINDHVLFMFQPAEEGPGGAEEMIAAEQFSKWRPDLIFGLHIAPEYPVGTIATKTGLLFANTSEIFIDFKGVGGHAAYPHLTNDMVIASCQFVTQLQTIVARNINPLDSAVVTIGKITGGTVQNSIAENARIEGTIRTLSEDSMLLIRNRILEMAKGMEVALDCKINVDFGSSYYQVYNESNLTEEFMKFLYQRQDTTFVNCKEAMTGEDFGYMIKEIPGFMFWLGVQSSYGLHHAKLNPDEKALPFAVSVITDYIRMKSI
ncbi:N-acetyldiaminopimelate deacetylase [Bacillus sp. D386]|uniref:N-acetyldiaminopimelate deacetylase n=1 Tax=Bacillus sp. D386 TaxID=2587155 RepID=UPI0011232163|nr:N-acetyldiaminopimelate deacetylase [Bacillus sp. D386]